MAQTIAELFYEALKHDLPEALASKSGGQYRPLSHQEVQAQVEHLALAMLARGLKAGDRLAILADNRTEWAILDFACALTGIVSVPVYPTLNPAQIAFILSHSGARWVVCGSKEHLAKVADWWPELPELEIAVVMNEVFRKIPDRTVLHWQELMVEGQAVDHRRPEIQTLGAERKPEDPLTLIYTSGTTGDPKGVLLSHKNVVSDVHMCLGVMQPVKGDRILSFLPLSHIFERTAGHFVMFYCGVSIYYTESFGALAQGMLDVQPHMIMVVPRVLEKIFTRVRDTVATSGIGKWMVFRWALGVGRRVVPHLYENKRPGILLRLQWKLADRLVFQKIRERTGGKLRFMISGGAALNPRLMDFFWAAQVPVYEGYGLTETSPVLTLSHSGSVRPGYVGEPVLETWDGKPFMKLGEDGELLVRGPNVMMGYWNNEEATKAVMDEEGYFHTGDVGEMDKAGRVKITDRKREILVTSAGKNVAPQPIENLLCADKYIEQAVLVGDHMNFISALIYPHFVTLKRWADHHHIHYVTEADLITNPKVLAKIMTRVDHANAKLSKFERIRKIALIPEEMSPENGILTASLKVKRRVVNEVYRDIIDRLYANDNGLSG